ncbi:Suf domain-containing protein [Chloropicon primus]|uniref:Suf domain-containing protein n=2 Tax=Chloropicon primus TaxID=1764295 RepID=A0A5B8MDU2_9CHLO|nr:Suf domain-containing protein [Chloropicon primus]UPQ97808.1 Suf domain-containing protein [Chloropicon primus]|eukprot:QDZ18599.1 Suf domain-containing protein [Chloropicon primus]
MGGGRGDGAGGGGGGGGDREKVEVPVKVEGAPPAGGASSSSGPKAEQSPAQEQGQASYKQPRRRGNVVRASQLNARAENLRERVKADKYDVDAWEALISELNPAAGSGRQQSSTRIRAPLETLKELYSEFLGVFPTSSAGWMGILEVEMSRGDQQGVNGAFGQCLLSVKSLDLWRVYIKHVKTTNRSDTPDGLSAIKQAYEFTLDHLGTDISSGPLWMEYVMFLQHSNAGVMFGETAPGNEESSKLVAIRRAFQRAVTIPTHSLESLWREYEKFENGVNRQLAKQILNDLQGQYATSRTIYRELKKKWEGISVNLLATPPGTKASQYKQQKLWTKLIAFEKSNPLKLEKEPLGVRIELVYNQCLLCLHHFPEIWYEYTTWHAGNGDHARASEVFTKACSALPACTMLHFAAADFEAAQDKIEEAKAIYEGLLSRIDKLEPNTQGQIWIQYMRFLRRTEGASASRKLFLRARKSEGCSHHIYSTSALLEWQNGKDVKVAKNIFELGLKSFLKETEYVLEYARFLISQGDISNARILYERALTVVQGDDARIIWSEFLKFEYQCGDLQSTLALEKRRKEALVEMMDDAAAEELQKHPQFNIGLLLLRYNVSNMLPCSEATLRHLQALNVQEAFYDLPKVSREEAKPTQSAPPQDSNGKTGADGLPNVISELISKLPPRHRMSGPLPTHEEVDSVIQVVSSLDFKALKAAQAAQGSGGRKRGAAAMDDRRSNRGRKSDATNMPPKYDVYRMRQQRQRTIK